MAVLNLSELGNNVVSLSGGKDSTAMLLMMLERGEKIHSVVFFDTGWEFPEMHDHIDLLEKNTGLKIWRLHSTLPFDYWLYARPVVARKGDDKGKVHRIGYGWPSMLRRWCTGFKVDAIKKFSKPIENAIQCVGYASDEQDRGFGHENIPHRFPLIEYGVTEADALEYCYSKGYRWNGLYDIFHRVSCFCCPLQRVGELRNLRKHYPALWSRMLEMDRAIPINRGFKGYKTVHDLEKKFGKQEKNKTNKFFEKEKKI